MKNTVKTLLSGLTTLAVTFSALSFTALATENKDTNDMTELIISSHEAYAGDIVTVTVDIKNNPGITAFGAVLTFDEELEFVEYENQGLLAMVSVYNVDERIAISGASISANYDDGAIINLSFKVPEEANEGTVYEIDWEYVDQLASNSGEINNRVVSGSITIIEEPIEESKIVGNLNSDDKINGTDATVVLRTYNELMSGNISELTNEQIIRADVNKDGKVNSQDATLILRFYNNSMMNPNITWEEVLNR